MLSEQELKDKYSRFVKPFYLAFKDYFGEDKIDLCLPYKPSELYNEYKSVKNLSFMDNVPPQLTIWFPNVEIKNEQGNSYPLKDVYMRLSVFPTNGCTTRLSLCTATYTRDQYNAGYMHSHAPSIGGDNVEFKNVCLGNGPLSHMVGYAPSKVSDDKLFYYYSQIAYEIERYVGVESLRGGPYIRMSSITYRGFLFPYLEFSDFTQGYTPLDFYTEVLSKYMQYLYDNNKIVYKHPLVLDGNTDEEMRLVLSDIVKQIMISHNMLQSAYYQHILVLGKMINGHFYAQRTSDYRSLPTHSLFTFKNKPVYIKVEENSSVSNFLVGAQCLVHPNILNKCKEYVFKLLNFSSKANEYRKHETAKVTENK